MSIRVLVADDDPHIRDVVEFKLRQSGHEIALAKNGAEALRLFADWTPDLIVLDVGMPERDGLDVCREIRKTSDVPILFLSARDEEVDRILGLEIGGDDYLTKPFSPRELVARIGVIMRRVPKASMTAGAAADEIIAVGDLAVDPTRHEATLSGRSVALTSKEFSLLRVLAAQPGRVFDRDVLMHQAYGGRVYVSDRTIDSHVRNIRRKFDAAGCDNVIETMHGIGFRLGACRLRDKTSGGSGTANDFG